MLAIEQEARAVLWSLAAEFAYMAIVGTRILHPHSLLRRRVARVITPELLSFLAMRISEEETVRLNSLLGLRLGGMPKCELIGDILPELYQLCVTIRTRGREPIYKVVDVAAPLAVVASVAGLREGDLLLASYRAAAFGRDKDMEVVMRTFSRWHIVSF
ncbi:MAG: hypothetical protein ACK4M3_00710 [Pyrobaculum sp.]